MAIGEYLSPSRITVTELDSLVAAKRKFLAQEELKN